MPCIRHCTSCKLPLRGHSRPWGLHCKIATSTTTATTATLTSVTPAPAASVDSHVPVSQSSVPGVDPGLDDLRTQLVHLEAEKVQLEKAKEEKALLDKVCALQVDNAALQAELTALSVPMEIQGGDASPQ